MKKFVLIVCIVTVCLNSCTSSTSSTEAVVDSTHKVVDSVKVVDSLKKK